MGSAWAPTPPPPPPRAGGGGGGGGGGPAGRGAAWGGGKGGGSQFVLPRGNGFRAGDRKPDRFEAETGILRCRQRLKLEIDEAHNVRHVARRQRERDIDRLHRAIDAVERKPQRARSHIVAGEHMRKRMHETARERDDRFLGKERLEQITQRVIDRRR